MYLGGVFEFINISGRIVHAQNGGADMVYIVYIAGVLFFCNNISGR